MVNAQRNIHMRYYRIVPLETYIILCTNVTPIHLIIKKEDLIRLFRIGSGEGLSEGLVPGAVGQGLCYPASSSA